MASTRPTKSDARAIQMALRKTTETLAHGLASRSAPTPDWSDFEWRIAIAAAAIHGVSALLCALPGWRAPPFWTRFLQEQTRHTLERCRRIEELLQRIDQRAREEGIALVGLKGAALYALGLYVLGQRPMADVDLLVSERDAARASRLLQWLGFHEQAASWKHQVFAADGPEAVGGLGEHSGNSMKIELHCAIGEALPLEITRITPLVWPADPRPGLNPYASKAALLAHMLLHASGSMVFRAVRLLHLHDIALLSASLSAADWDELLSPSCAARWWALPPLELTARYYPTAAIPAQVLEALAEGCSGLLRQVHRRRTLSDESLSYLWIGAFPGIEWSRTPAEMLRYAANRIRPSGAMREQRRELLRHRPPGSQTHWQHLSQGRRMLRWLISRPARDESLAAVQAALAVSS